VLDAMPLQDLYEGLLCSHSHRDFPF